jgi:hypothetical protein
VEPVAGEPFLPPLDGALRVGIRWAGWRHHPDDLVRSTRLADWEPVLQVPGVRFYSLQLDEPAEFPPFAHRVEDLAPELTAWDRTAAAMMQLDLIISVDTSVAHLAGALGRPVWICLAADPEWRWMLERTDTPGYGSARLFRQTRVGDWSTIFAEIAAELQQLVSTR